MFRRRLGGASQRVEHTSSDGFAALSVPSLNRCKHPLFVVVFLIYFREFTKRRLAYGVQSTRTSQRKLVTWEVVTVKREGVKWAESETLLILRPAQRQIQSVLAQNYLEHHRIYVGIKQRAQRCIYYPHIRSASRVRLPLPSQPRLLLRPPQIGSPPHSPTWPGLGKALDRIY